MNSSTVDTLELFEDFKKSFTEEQAQKLSKALKRIEESRLDELATKRDLVDLATRWDLAQQETRLTKWVIGVAGAQAALIVALLKLLGN